MYSGDEGKFVSACMKKLRKDGNILKKHQITHIEFILIIYTLKKKMFGQSAEFRTGSAHFGKPWADRVMDC